MEKADDSGLELSDVGECAKAEVFSPAEAEDELSFDLETSDPCYVTESPASEECEEMSAEADDELKKEKPANKKNYIWILLGLMVLIGFMIYIIFW